MELLANYTTPEEMLSVDTQTLVDLLNKTSHGYLGLGKAVEIQQTAKNSFGITLASSSFALIIRQYLEQLKSLESSIKKFSSVPKLVAYAGIYPKSRQSGESKSDGRMSKRVSPYLRRAVWLATSVAAFKDPTLSAFYQKKRDEGKKHLTAIGHVCHKVLAIIFAVLRDNKPYISASTS